MSAVEPSPFVFAVLCAGVGGSVLALAGIWAERHMERRAKRIFCGVLCFCLGVAAAVSWMLHQPLEIVATILVLEVASLAAFALQTALGRRWASRILEPLAIWTLLLIVSPVFTLGYARHASRPDPLSVVLAAPDPSIRKDPAGPHAVTDMGRDIGLFHYGSVHSLESLEEAVIELAGFTYEVIRIKGPSDDSNCHGWVFTGGQFCVASEQVDSILADNGYQPVEQPQGGDLVIYRDASGLPAHSALVRFVGEDGRVLVESKWGPLGVFLHSPETQPFSNQFNFWRSPRLGHQLHILSPAYPADAARERSGSPPGLVN